MGTFVPSIHPTCWHIVSRFTKSDCQSQIFSELVNWKFVLFHLVLLYISKKSLDGVQKVVILKIFFSMFSKYLEKA